MKLAQCLDCIVRKIKVDWVIVRPVISTNGSKMMGLFETCSATRSAWSAKQPCRKRFFGTI